MPPVVRSKLPDVGTTIFTVMSARAAEYGAINLSQGFPDFAVPQSLREGLSRAVHAGHNQYAPMAGLMALREQVAASVLRHHGRRVDPVDEVTVVPGATEAIFCAIMASVMPGDEVILFDPAYDSYEPSVRMAGGRAVRIPLQPPDFRVDWQRVKEAIGPRTRLIAINTPHNPTGTMLEASDLDALEELLAHADALLLSDEVYEHLASPSRSPAGRWAGRPVPVNWSEPSGRSVSTCPSLPAGPSNGRSRWALASMTPTSGSSGWTCPPSATCSAPGWPSSASG